MEDDLKLQDFDQWVKIFILKHEGGNLSKGSKISGHPNAQLKQKLSLLEGFNSDRLLTFKVIGNRSLIYLTRISVAPKVPIYSS